LSITTNKPLLKFLPHETTGEFAIIAQPGKYKIKVSSDKFKDWIGDFIIPEREQQADPYIYNIIIENTPPKLF